jgi:rhodanese-related sulfurtransferase
MTSSATDRVPGATVSEVFALLEGEAQLIDVRDDKEWAAGHSPHSVHVPMSELSDATTWITRTRRVIVASRSGRRAADAARHLRAAGVDAVRLEGGMHAWARAGGPLVADGDRTPHVT